jgi:hypothetical protein
LGNPESPSPEITQIHFAFGPKSIKCAAKETSLAEAARLWASEHGYTILPVGGSSPVTWGGL